MKRLSGVNWIHAVVVVLGLFQGTKLSSRLGWFRSLFVCWFLGFDVYVWVSNEFAVNTLGGPR